ncbi:MAG: DUF86 domain-containing protein [Erysipelotrichaceae bacterium]|nr:DUF86 domain-containing protein [Erysipelotrichaceae bacterium]
MDNHKNDLYFIEKAISNIDAIISYSANKDYNEFINDELLIDAVMFRLIQMAENIKFLSEDFKIKNNRIVWNQIIGFRNRIIHDYGKTDYSVVYEIISADIY